MAMKMCRSVMPPVGPLFIVVLLGFYVSVGEGRHVPLTGQSPAPRTRLLVIRPPPGTNQPNRVLIITDPRTSTTEVAKVRTDPNQTRASDPFGFNTNKPIERTVRAHIHPRPHHHGGSSPRSGHPQSQVRRRARVDRRRGGGGQSLRTLLDDARNSMGRSPAGGSNIARVSDTIPRAAPPVIPTDARFGDLNMPSGIEAALKKLRQQAVQLGRVRDQVQGNIQTADRNPAMSRGLLDLLRKSLMAQNGGGAGRNAGSGRFTGQVGTVDRVGRRNRTNTRSNVRTQEPAVNIAGTSNKSANSTGSQSQSNSVKASKKRVINSGTTVITNNGVVSPVASSKLAESKNLNMKKSSGSTNTNNNANGMNVSPIVGSAGAVKGGKGILSVNGTAEVKASAAKAQSNTTETKSLKTKNIKVTTVIKGGTAADVAAAAASQAEIANAVAQGKEINSSSLAAITGKAKAAVAPVGSITVKREPNGVSVITLSDGQGEPVVLRASGPVKIERIIKPNGKVQFLINPVAATRAPIPEGEIEPEDVTTVASTTTEENLLYAGSTTVGSVSPPTFMPTFSMNPFFDYITTSTHASKSSGGTLADGLVAPGDVGLPVMSDNVMNNELVAPPVPENTPVATVDNKGLVDNKGPIVNQDTSLAGLKPLTKAGEIGGSTVNAVNGLAEAEPQNIPRPPRRTKSGFGPFDMLNSVIDFNRNSKVPRLSDVSIVESVPTTFTPPMSKRNTVRKKTVKSTDAMPQYSLVSSSPSLKIVQRPFP